MAAHFVIAHRLLLENCSGGRLKGSTNDFLSLFPMHIQRPSSRNQHEVYIMSCNIASALGYGTPIYPQVADLFSKKQSSGSANESAPAMETEYVRDRICTIALLNCVAIALLNCVRSSN